MIQFLADMVQDSTGLTNQPEQAIQSKQTKLLIVETILEMDSIELDLVFNELDAKYQLTTNLSNELLNRFRTESNRLDD